MAEYRNGSHTKYDIKYHVVWVTKYRYKIMRDRRIAERLKELIKQGCRARDIEIISGSISSDHVHMLISCPATMSPSQIVQYLKEDHHI